MTTLGQVLYQQKLAPLLLLRLRLATSNLYLLSVKGSMPISMVFTILKMLWPAWRAVVSSERSGLSWTPMAVTQVLVTDLPATLVQPTIMTTFVTMVAIRTSSSMVFLTNMSTREGALGDLPMKKRTETKTSYARVSPWSSVSVPVVCVRHARPDSKSTRLARNLHRGGLGRGGPRWPCKSWSWSLTSQHCSTLPYWEVGLFPFLKIITTTSSFITVG